jgi:hypothetical protein
MELETKDMFATAATADQVDAGVGVIWWATHPEGSYAMTAIDYDIFDVAAINSEWLEAFFKRSADLVEKHQPAMRECLLRVEHSGLNNVLKRADDAFRDTPAARTVNRSVFDIRPVKEYETGKWPKSLDERAFEIRPLVDSGKIVKIETGLRRFSFRSIRTNHLIAQVKAHRPGDATTAGELLHAFVLGVLLGTKRRSSSFFDVAAPRTAKSTASKGPFGAYVPGKRPW